MLQHPCRLSWPRLLVVLGLLGAVGVGGLRSARAQGDSPPAGTAVDVGDNWQVTVEAATLPTDSPDAEPTAAPRLLEVVLSVHNLEVQSRFFPTYRLHLLHMS